MKAVVHIGMEKTGSTSLQKAMIEMADELAAHGMQYGPARDNEGQHSFLPFLACTPEYSRRFALSTRHESQLAARDAIKDELRDHIECSQHARMILSSEHCSSFLYTLDCVSNLRDFLREVFEEIEIVLYLRRQDRLSLSFYSTHLRLGGSLSDPFGAADRGLLNYEHLLHRWANAFGKSNVKAFFYDDIVRDNISIVQHFSEYLGIAGKANEKKENVGLTPLEATLMREINAQMGPFNGSTVRSAISMVARNKAEHAASLVSSDAARAYMTQFEASNEAARAWMFPERQSLFDQSFAEYSDQPPDNGAFTSLAVDTLAEAGRLISDLEIRVRALQSLLEQQASNQTK